jgi:hypothetical protein
MRKVSYYLMSFVTYCALFCANKGCIRHSIYFLIEAQKDAYKRHIQNIQSKQLIHIFFLFHNLNLQKTQIK